MADRCILWEADEPEEEATLQRIRIQMGNALYPYQ